MPTRQRAEPAPPRRTGGGRQGVIMLVSPSTQEAARSGEMPEPPLWLCTSIGTGVKSIAAASSGPVVHLRPLLRDL
jgi:hypothetical protein